MSGNNNIIDSLTNTVNKLEDAFFEIDLGLLQCPDIKKFTGEFITNIDLLKQQISLLSRTTNNYNSTVNLDFITYQQLNKLSLTK